MNERIRNLAEHCDFYVGNEHYNESNEEKQRLWSEKFAELIVQECMEWCDAHATINGTAQQIRNSIKNYFGVEE